MFEERSKPYRRPPALLTIFGRVLMCGALAVGALAIAQNAGFFR